MVKQIGGKTCYIYDCGSSDVLMIQPVDDHDIEVLDSEVKEIRRLEHGLTDSKSVGPIFFGGYSLTGFFALWAAYQTDLFSGVAAASPSVWFPGWIGHAENNAVKAGKVYLSLGDKEEKTRNPVMRTVGDNIRRQHELLQADPACEKCILEMNQGNHFKEPDIRTAKGFAWLLQNQ